VSHFESEIREQPEILARLLEDDRVRGVASELRARAPRLITTLARGSSDNAVTFFGYLAAQTLGLPVASLPPSLLSVYGTPLQLGGSLCVGVSQSGESSDVVEGLAGTKRAGAVTLALCNDADSTLAAAADYTLLQGAGREQAVAASKTFSSQMLLLALLVAHWSEDAGLLAALGDVPERIAALLDGPQEALQHLALQLTGAHSCYVLGRGLSYAPALETALKLKETCYLHAEAYSSAEFQHGPLAAVNPSDPVLMLALADRTEPANLGAARKLREANAALSVVTSSAALRAEADAALTLPVGLHPVTEAFVMVIMGQLLALYLASAKGLDPDAPRHLNKVTKTL
jgi:glutamine---fructose-6-phosphate transaminase (isomerizing)